MAAGFFGSVVAGTAWGFKVGFEAALRGHALQPLKSGINVLAWSLTLGMWPAAARAVSFTLCLVKPWLHESDATGIAWWAAPIQSYDVTLSISVLLVALIMAPLKVRPPALPKLTGPLEELSRAQGIPHALSVLCTVFTASPVEEFVF